MDNGLFKGWFIFVAVSVVAFWGGVLYLGYSLIEKL